MAARCRVVPNTKPVFGWSGTWLERAKCAFSKNQLELIIFVQNFVLKYVQNFVLKYVYPHTRAALWRDGTGDGFWDNFLRRILWDEFFERNQSELESVKMCKCHFWLITNQNLYPQNSVSQKSTHFFHLVFIHPTYTAVSFAQTNKIRKSLFLYF